MKKYNVMISGIIVEYVEGNKVEAGRFHGNVVVDAEDAEKAISAVRNISLYDHEEVKVNFVELAEDEVIEF